MRPVILAYHFAAHTIVGLMVFAIVGGGAVLLNHAIMLIEADGVSPYIILAVRGLE